jgi:Tol biopolymer transport system component
MVGTTLWPRWSPDGKFLIYLQLDPVSSRGRLTIVVRSLESGEERTLRPELRIDHQFNTRPSLSPDGRSIFLAASDSKGRQGIYQVDARTAAATPVVRAEPSGVVRLPALSPDGKTLFYQQRGQGRTALVARELETGREKKIYEPDEQDGTLPYFSPSRDGRQLAFVQVERTMPARSALFVIPAAGGAPRELFRVEDPVSLLGPSAPGWTPDGRYIIVRTYREAKPEPERILWAIPAAGGEPKKLGQAPAGLMLGFDVHPDGQRIAFTAGDSKQEFWVLQNFLPQTRAAK